jgi:sirohydrochlorin ferrochelatase
MLADIALRNPAHDEPEPKHPGERALEEHKAVIRTVKKAAAKTIRSSVKHAA